MAKTQNEAEYSLPRDAIESSRLDDQHRVWHPSIGYYLNPDILSRLPAEAKISDVGTGTGVWLRELAAESPTTWAFEGLDMSSAQFPHSSQENVSFRLYDLRNPVPADLRNRYDAAHLRSLIGGLNGEADWKLAMSNVKDLLKPGGFIQWEEMDARQFKIEKSLASAASSALATLRDEAVGRNVKAGKTIGIAPLLADLMQQTGFTNVQQTLTTLPFDDDTRIEYTLVTANALLSSLKFFASRPESTIDITWIERLQDQCLTEIKSGLVSYSTSCYIVSGQKPT